MRKIDLTNFQVATSGTAGASTGASP